MTNRLASESELVVVQATGYSPYRLAQPVIVFGVIVAIFLSILTHYLVPASITRLNERKAEIAENLTARILRDGVFLHPAKGTTFYIREISPEGELRDVFISDATSPEQTTTYTARRAILINDKTGPKLAMFDGMAQVLRADSQRLSTTSFDDLVLNIADYVDGVTRRKLRPSQLTTAELLWPTPEVLTKVRSSRARLLQEGHARISQATLCIVAVLIGFSTLLLGGFSRFGLWRQILAAIVFLILIKTLDNVAVDAARDDENRWPLVYVSSLAGLVLSYALLWISARPAIFSRRLKAAQT